MKSSSRICSPLERESTAFENLSVSSMKKKGGPSDIEFNLQEIRSFDVLLNERGFTERLQSSHDLLLLLNL